MIKGIQTISINCLASKYTVGLSVSSILLPQSRFATNELRGTKFRRSIFPNIERRRIQICLFRTLIDTSLIINERLLHFRLDEHTAVCCRRSFLSINNLCLAT